MNEMEGFRYRSKDAWRAVTRIAVREARLKEIKQEIFNSKKLKTFFEDNQNDFQLLRHDKALHTVKVQPHLANVPEYIVPATLKNLAGIHKGTKRKWNHKAPTSAAAVKFQKKKNDPLLSMQFEGFNKKKRKN